MTTTSAPERKVVLLTGASSKIGHAFCKNFATTYDIVAVHNGQPLRVPSQHQSYIDPFAPQEADAPTDTGDSVFEVTADLREKAEVARVVELALARFGTIDAVVNTIGVLDGGSDLLGSALSRAPELFQLNALVPTEVAVEVALDYWRHHDLDNAERNRVVVNVSTTASVDTSDRSSGVIFGATKAAQNLLSLHLADELRPFNVRVVTVAPAHIPDIVKPRRVASAIASLIEGNETGRILLMWDAADEMV